MIPRHSVTSHALHWRPSWVAFTAAVLLSLAGLFLFKLGFLLSRHGLAPLASDCFDPPPAPGAFPDHVPQDGACWAPRPHPHIRRAVVLLVDALRYDFALPKRSVSSNEIHFRNRLPVLSSTGTPGSVLLRATADPPTTTFQRLKALMTGNLPTFVEMGSNFGGGDIIRDDSILNQIALRRKRHLTARTSTGASANGTTMMGDDTWLLLYPHLLDRVFPYPSLDVWDLHTVDNGCTAHLFEEMRRNDWDLLVSHFLGVDHAGHRYAPSHPAMGSKLDQMNGVIERVVAELPDDALLVVLGDHGMDPKGDHGGDSVLETDAAMWFYTKHYDRVIQQHGALLPDGSSDPFKEHPPINQIDLVPTMALILGLPIPLENLGSLIPHLFPDPDYYARALQLNAAQVRKFLDVYATAAPGDFSPAALAHLPDPVAHAADFLASALSLCRQVWARFDLFHMIAGLVLLLVAVVLCLPNNLAPFLLHLLFQNQQSPFLATIFSILAPVVAGCLVYSDNGVIFEDTITFWFLVAVLAAHLLFSRPPRRATAKLLSALALLTVAHQVTVCRPEQHACHNTYNDSGLLGHVLAAAGVLALLIWALIGAGASTRPQERTTRLVCAVLVVFTQIADQELLLPVGLFIPRALGVWAVRVHLLLLMYSVLVAHTLPKHTAVMFAIAQFHRLSGLTGLVAAVVALDAAVTHSLPASRTEQASPLVVTVAHLLLRVTLFTTGHQSTLSSIQWNVGHLGLWNTHYLLSPLAVLANTVGHVAIVMGHLPTWPAVACVVAWEVVSVTHASIAALILRRHLMVWAVFAPRWMVSVLMFVVMTVSVGVRWIAARRR